MRKCITCIFFLLLIWTVKVNSLENPGFETGDLTGWEQGWFPQQAGSVITRTAACSGIYGLWIYTDNINSWSWSKVYQSFPAIEGNSYQCSSLVRLAPYTTWPSGSQVCLVVEFPGVQEEFCLNLPYLSCQELVVNITAPEGTSQGTFSLFIEKSEGVIGQAIANFDDCEVILLATPTASPTETPTPSPSCVYHGDVNFSCEISAEDAQLAFMIALGEYEPTYEENCAADCTGNGEVTAGDAQSIFLCALGYECNCIDFISIPTCTPVPTLSLTFDINACWVCYSPLNYNPENGVIPSEESVRSDLSSIRDFGFDGIVTYGDIRLAWISCIAKEEFDLQVIMGVWDPTNDDEIEGAIQQASCVDAFCIGNEGLYIRYSVEQLVESINRVRNETMKSVTTTEEWHDYEEFLELCEIGDWIFPNTHPYWAGIKNSVPQAVNWVSSRYESLQERCHPKRILLKEAGYPTEGDPECSICNQEGQRDFFIELQNEDSKFCWFEFGDQFWKTHEPVEPFWGLVDRYRNAKDFRSLTE